jgi:hypothetical protein
MPKDFITYAHLVCEVLHIHAQGKFRDGLRTKLQHVDVHVPRLADRVKFIKHLVCALNGLLHGRRVVSYSPGAKSRRQELVCNLPLRCICVSQENTRLRCLDTVQRMRLSNLLSKEVRLSECNRCNVWVVRVVDGSTHVRCLEKRPILLEQTLVVAQMVREHFEEVADVGEALGSGNGADRMSIYGDSNGFLRRQNFLGAGERVIATTETDTFWTLIL